MKIIQICTSISYGDGVGNDVLALHDVITNMGYETGIYAEQIDHRIRKYFIQEISQVPKLTNQDIILYHLCTGTPLNFALHKYKGRKIIIYHNITPPEFFQPYSRKFSEASADGLRGMRYLANVAEYCLAVSAFNKRDLVQAGYACKIDVLPIMIPFEDYAARPDPKILERYTGDGYTNLLFIGRVTPNKMQEDVIRVFYYYHKYYNSRSRLFLVGAIGIQNYYQRLQDYVEELELQNVYFTNHIKFGELLAYYKVADAFICMSEHEGFCIPLIEAMYFGVPIIAYDSSAVGDTLGGSGFLTKTKDPLINAAILDHILSDQKLRQTIINNEKERLKCFDNKLIAQQFAEYIRDFIENSGE